MKLPEKLAKQLLFLLESETHCINEGEIKHKKILEKMLTDGVLYPARIHTNHRQVYCRNPQRLHSYLNNKYEITDLAKYIQVFDNQGYSRSDNLDHSKNEKSGNTKAGFEGFLINTYEEIYGYLGNEKILLKPIAGSFIFIHDFRNFRIDRDITVIVVENYENFVSIKKQKHLFVENKPLFVWRYQNSTKIAEWLESIENPYIHFGDFDLSGIKIYITEFRNKISNKERCSFFIPHDIEKIIAKQGSKKRYDEQFADCEKFDFSVCPETIDLVRIIKKHTKALPQEWFID